MFLRSTSFGTGRDKLYKLYTVVSDSRVLKNNRFQGMGWFYNTLRMKGYILRTCALWGRGLMLALVSVSLIALFTEYAHTQVRFAKTYGGISDDMARFVQQTSDGGYILVGYTDSFGAGDYDIFLIKTDANGNIQWAKTYGGTNKDGATSVQQTSDGGYILAGWTYSFSADGAGIFLIKTDARGNVGSCSIVQDAKPIVNNAPFGVTSRSPSVSSPRFTVNSVSPTVTSPNPTVSAPCP